MANRLSPERIKYLRTAHCLCCNPVTECQEDMQGVLDALESLQAQLDAALERIAPMEEAACMATSGPWEQRGDNLHKSEVWENGRGVEKIADVWCGAFESHGRHNARHIAATNPAAILDLVRVLRGGE